MGYSTAHFTGEASDHNEDDTSLLHFSIKRTKKFCEKGENLLEKIVRTLVSPTYFIGTLLIAPRIYTIDDKYIEGTPQYFERIKKIRVHPDKRGIGVIIEYPD